MIRFQYVFILVSCEQELETTKCCFLVISLLFKASIGALKLVRYFCRLHGQAFCEGVPIREVQSFETVSGRNSEFIY